MERTTRQDVVNAFREWLAMIGVKSGNQVGEFRMGYDGFGRNRIEQIINKDGAIHVIYPNMNNRQFVDAVYFLKLSLLTKEKPQQYVVV